MEKIVGLSSQHQRIKSDFKTGYLKSIQWVRKDIYFVVKNRILVKKGKK